MEVLSTKASPTLCVSIPEGDVSRKQACLVATDHSIVSRTRVHIHGEAPDPCPVPSILLISLLM